MTDLHLVRHGPPAVDHTVPAARWGLSADADIAVAVLAAAAVLPGGARWFSSPEPKALATARSLTTTSVTVYDALCEVRRPAGDVDGFEAHVRHGFDEPDQPALPDWEPYTAAAQRISRGVGRLLDGVGDQPLVVVGHGTSLVLLVAELTGERPDVAAWQRLTFPDHCLLTGDSAGRIASSWGSWRGTA